MPDKVNYIHKGVQAHGALSASQANRTNFTPGKPTANADAENWPRDDLAVAGVNVNDMWFNRRVMVGHGIVGDQTPQVAQADAEDAFDADEVESLPFREQPTGGDFLKARPE